MMGGWREQQQEEERDMMMHGPSYLYLLQSLAKHRSIFGIVASSQLEGLTQDGDLVAATGVLWESTARRWQRGSQ